MRHSTRTGTMRCAIVAAVTATLAACTDGSSSVVQPGLPRVSAARGTDTPVSSYLADADSTIAPSLQVRSDGLGVYRNSNTLISVIQPIGAWVLDSEHPRNATRTVFLDFGQPVPSSGPNGGPPIAVPSGLYKVHAIAACNVYNNSLWSLVPGATMPCPLHIAFDYAGSAYAVQMNPFATGADPNGAPETQWAAVTCLTPEGDAGPCSEWLLTPSATYTAPDGSLKYRNVARLIKYVTTKNATTNVNQGDFYFSFAIRVTNP